jgi:hypothetical protein
MLQQNGGQLMSERQKLYSYRVDKEEAEKQGKRLSQTMHLPGFGDIPISVAEVNAAHVSLTGRQALALLRILERNRIALEREAEAERDREFGRGPGIHAAEVPQKIRKGDPRLGKRALTYGDHTLDGKVTAIFRYSNGAEQIEVTQRIRVQGERRSGTAVACVHADDVDML